MLFCYDRVCSKRLFNLRNEVYFHSSRSLLPLTTALPLISSELLIAQSSSIYSFSSSGGNAKVAGHLFNIDGKVEYFAGMNAWWLAHLSSNKDVDISLANCRYRL